MSKLTICLVGVCLVVGILRLAASAAATPVDDKQTCTKASGDVAIAACTRAIASGHFKGRDLAMIFRNRGVEYRDKSDFDRAIADYNEAIRLDPKYADVYISRGNAWLDKSDPDQALVDYGEAIRLSPKSALAYNNRGIAWDAKNDLNHAIADYTEAIRLDPKYADAYIRRGNAWLNKGDLDHALVDYDEAIRLDPKSATAYYDRGIAYGVKRDYDRAIADYNEVIRLDPKYVDAYIKRGNAWLAQSDLEHAMADYEAAIRLDPKSAVGYNNRGVVWRDKGDRDRAIADYNEAIRLDPKYSPAYDNRGDIYRDKGDLERAIDDYSEAIRFDPKYTMAYHDRGIAWGSKGDLSRAIADYTEAIRLDPEFTAAYTNRGLAYEKKGDLTRARADFELALEKPQKYDSGRWARDTARERLTSITSNQAVVAPVQQPLSPTLTPNAFDRRIALVIGNSDYAVFSKLSNPRNDAKDLATTLKGLGFDVLLGLDLKRARMEEILIQFAREARTSDTALVFYAGHGLQHLGVNYLAPIDAVIEDETDLRKLFNLQDVMNDLQGASRVRILIVDACRDNEVIKQLSARLPTTRSAAFSRGLARIDAADGTLVAFATQPNRVAKDGTGRNSPFTQALLKYLPTAGLELRTLMTRVRAEVVNATGGAQRPEVWDSLVGEFVFSSR